MEGGGGSNEAGGVEEGVGLAGHFRTVGEAVEEGEEADDRGAGPEGQADGEGDEEAEEEDGGEDTGLDHRKVEPSQTESAADGHEANETGGDGPDGATTHLRGPEADGDHGQKVIEAMDRVIDPMKEAVNRADPGVRVSQRGQGEGEQREQGFAVHEGSIFRAGRKQRQNSRPIGVSGLIDFAAV